MKKTILLLISVLIFFSIFSFYSCSDSATNPSKDANAYVTLSGNIDNWSNGQKKLKAEVIIPESPFSYVVGTSTIGTDGSFSITLLSPYDNQLMDMGFAPDEQCSGTPAITSGSKYTYADLCIYDEHDSCIGVVFKSNLKDTAATGLVEVQYLFANQKIDISGYKTCLYPWGDTVSATYDFHGKRGWNTLVCAWDSYSPPNSLISYTSAVPASSMKWFYYSWQTYKRLSRNKHFLNY